MILVQKLAILILLCSALHFEGVYSRKLTCKKKVYIGELFSATCKRVGRKAKWMNNCEEDQQICCCSTTTTCTTTPTTTEPATEDKYEEPPKPFKTDRSRTQGAMMQSQSSLLSELNHVQQNAFWKASLDNGNIDVPKCPLNKLIQCNENREVTKCINEGPKKFTQCVQPFCQSCGCALVSLLGFNCESQIMERFILNTTETMDEFSNILETPFNSNSPSKFRDKLYMNYYGALIPEDNSSKLKERLSNHTSYFANKYGWTKSQRRGPQHRRRADTAQTIIDTADSLVDLIVKTKDVVLGKLEKEIKKINLDVKGITQTQQAHMTEALTALYTAEVYSNKIRALLETLAEETIVRVEHMIYFLSKVEGDLEHVGLLKFLKFQALKMTHLVERSLTLLEEANNLYSQTLLNMAVIKAKLKAFQTFVEDLSNRKSEAYKERVKAIRMEVYIPCCIITGSVGCSICAIGVETAINGWESELNSLKTVLGKNQKHTENLTADLDENINFMNKEVKLIIKWQGALSEVSDEDYAFPETQIWAFSVDRPEVVSSLNNLKTAATNYLQNKKEDN